MAVPTETSSPTQMLRRVVGASMIGTVIEWYDFFLYGTAAALIFNKLFFPTFEPLTGTLLAFATYGLGFVARPVGGVVFGHFGDRIGRKRLLMFSLIVMGITTALIGLLPTYEDIGVWAPILLITLRLVQGFAVGGEWGGAVLMVAEHSDAKNRGFWTSWPQAAVTVGNLLAAGVFAAMAALQTTEDFLSWGWRIPFILSAVLVAVGWWMRAKVTESPAFREAQALMDEQEKRQSPVLQALFKRPGGLAIGAGLRLGENISYYVVTAFSITYIVELRGGDKSSVLFALMCATAIEGISIPLFSALSDRVGRRIVYAVGAFGMTAWIFAFFLLLEGAGLLPIVVAMSIGLILHGAMYGPQAAFLCELFPTHMRYSGVSLAYQATSIVAGSMAPIIAIALYQRMSSWVPIAIYVAVTCVVSAVAALLARETRGDPLDG